MTCSRMHMQQKSKAKGKEIFLKNFKNLEIGRKNRNLEFHERCWLAVVLLLAVPTVICNEQENKQLYSYLFPNYGTFPLPQHKRILWIGSDQITKREASLW